MTPKEKAKELVDAMHYHIEFYHMRGSAIECAKVAVDEILNIGCIEVPYWMEVKTEIEKL